MRTSKKKSLHEHLLAMAVAVVVVAAVSVSVNRSGLLTADILQGGSNNASAQGADISYISTGNKLVVHSEKTFMSAQSVTFLVVYNPESVLPDATKIDTPYDYTSSSGKGGSTHITVFLSGAVSAHELLVSLPFSGNGEDLTISDASVIFSGGAADGLAIEKK